MRIITTIKILLFILALTLVTIFFLQNTGPVGIQFPFGKAGRLGLIYLLLIAYFSGVFSSFFMMIIISAKVKKRRRLRESEELVEEE